MYGKAGVVRSVTFWRCKAGGVRCVQARSGVGMVRRVLVWLERSFHGR